MLRFVVNLVLIPGVLLAQFAAVPHAHADDASETAHHDHPHFHLHLFGAGGERSALRACCDATCGEQGAESAPAPDHDTDAVYVESATASPDREKPFAPLFWTEPGPPACAASAPGAQLAWRHAPALTPSRPHCPLYVLYRALTI